MQYMPFEIGLDFFTLHNALETHPNCYGMYLQFFPSYYWTYVHGMDVPQFVFTH